MPLACAKGALSTTETACGIRRRQFVCRQFVFKHTMPMTSPSIEDGVATSPRKYSSAFRSNVGRMAKISDKESTNLQYEVKQYDTAVCVERSPRKLAAVFSPRTGKAITFADGRPVTESKKVVAEPTIYTYDTDSVHMNKTTIRHGQEHNPEVLLIGTLYSKCIRALTFENVWQDYAVRNYSFNHTSDRFRCRP